jgi:ketosteroid isomerase-like protein
MKSSVAMTVCVLGVLIGPAAAFSIGAQAPTPPPATQAPVAPDKALMQKIVDAWSTMNPDNVAQYYAQEGNNVFYDFTPLKYAGWKEYAEGVRKIVADYSSAKFSLNPDAQVHRRGNLAWGTATWHADFVKKDSTKEVLDGRWTVVWEKRGDNWLIVHDHYSVPLGAPSQTPTRKTFHP